MRSRKEIIAKIHKWEQDIENRRLIDTTFGRLSDDTKRDMIGISVLKWVLEFSKAV